jgi:hypothetical protein
VLAAQMLFAILQRVAVPGLVARAGGGRVPLLDPPEFHLTPFLLDLARSRSLDGFAALPREHAHLAALALVGALSVGAALIAGILAAKALSRGVLALGAQIPRTPLFIAWALFEGVLWIQWIPGRASTIRDMGRGLDARLPGGAVVSPGGAYSLESRLRFDSRAVLEGRMFDPSGGATHFIALVEHPMIGELPQGEIERRWPGSTRLATFALTGGYVYGLWAAPTSSEITTAAPLTASHPAASPPR